MEYDSYTVINIKLKRGIFYPRGGGYSPNILPDDGTK